MSDLQFRPAEFEALPLEAVVAAPLVAAINAAAAAALSTADFIEKLKDKNVELKMMQQVNNTVSEVDIKAPLLALVPVPHLRIDSLTTHFKYEISQTVQDKQTMQASGNLEIGLPRILSLVGKFGLTGTVSRANDSQYTTNRSGVLEITLHAAEAEIPKGLEKILNLLASAIQVQVP